ITGILYRKQKKAKSKNEELSFTRGSFKPATYPENPHQYSFWVCVCEMEVYIYTIKLRVRF
ncbi:MAG TPA: hypothetical protein PKK99_13670, partial [Bacteroidia bacterium]|nr:hypothetical protein [Bacteroidia bacterium]